MKKILLIIAAFGVFSIQAADMKWGIGYTSVSDDDVIYNGDSVTIGGIDLSVNFDYGNNFSSEFGIIEGIRDEDDSVSVLGVVVPYSISLGTSFYARGFYHVNDNFFINAVFGNYELEANVANIVRLEESDTELGFGAGVQFEVEDRTFRFMYEDVDGQGIISLKALF
tara:strand:- start:13 stop:516 length:504 start_codon:yes stop_codon:yes gene_type:complete